MTKEKRLVLTWTKEQLDAYEDEHDFIKMCLDEAAKNIGYMAIMSPYEAVQWVGNELQENEENGTVQLYVKLNLYEAENPEYYERTKKVEDDEDGRNDSDECKSE